MLTDNEQWRGFDLDELRVRRIVNLTKIELEHMRLGQFTDKYTGKSGVKGGQSILSKLLGTLDYIDYGIIAYQIGKRAFSMLKRRRK